MANEPIIVNFGQLTEGFGSGDEAVAGLAAPGPTDDLEAAMVVATLQRGVAALEDAQVEPDVMSSPDDPVAAVLQSLLAENAASLGTPAPLAAGGREVRFDQYDIRWAKTLVGLIKTRLNIGKFDFRAGPTSATVIPSRTRVAVLGDWGTNLYGAPLVAESVQSDGDFGVLIHLGDVYYSGSAAEVQGRFLAEWPRVPGAINRACNSNHEMYSGGKPYVEQTLSAFQQSSSLFWLENDHWVLVGLDSAYDDGKIGPLQNDWLRVICDRAGPKRVVLFSHHQPWRTDNGDQQHLVDPILDLLRTGRIAGWYWGHEHLCSLYEPHPLWEMWGACVGHSGFPYPRLDVDHWLQEGAGVAEDGAWHQMPARDHTPRGLLLDGPNQWINGHESKFGPNGYAVLELDGPNLRELVFSATGQEINARALL